MWPEGIFVFNIDRNCHIAFQEFIPICSFVLLFYSPCFVLGAISSALQIFTCLSSENPTVVPSLSQFYR